MPSSRRLVGCCLVGNLAAFDRGTHALRRVAPAADRSSHVLVRSATATIRSNGPLCGQETFEYLVANTSWDLAPCRGVLGKERPIVRQNRIRHML